MNEKDFLGKVYHNMEAFYTMTLASAMVSTYNSEESDSDAEKIIRYIGEAYRLEDSFIDECKEKILGDMMSVGLVSDYLALSSLDMLDDKDRQNIALYDIKGQIIEQVNHIKSRDYTNKSAKAGRVSKNQKQYETFHHPYNAYRSFFSLNKLAEFGEMTATRQVALLYITGVGCEKNLQKAEQLLLRCVFWSDKVSVKLLAYLYRLLNNGEKEKCCEKIYELEKDTTITHSYCLFNGDEAERSFSLIRLIKNAVILQSDVNIIDTVFVDVMANASVPVEKKTAYIVDYKNRPWNKEVLSGTDNQFIGFRVKNNV